MEQDIGENLKEAPASINDISGFNLEYTTSKAVKYSTNEIFSIIRNNDIGEVKEALIADPLLLGKLDMDGWSMIHHCAAYGTPQMMEVLVEHGADIDACTNGLYTPAMNVSGSPTQF